MTTKTVRVVKTGSILGDDVLVDGKVAGRIRKSTDSVEANPYSNISVGRVRDSRPWKVTVAGDGFRAGFPTKKAALAFLAKVAK